jgi:hypothetical protein
MLEFEMRRIIDKYKNTLDTLANVGVENEQYVLVNYGDLKVMIDTMADVVKQMDKIGGEHESQR